MKLIISNNQNPISTKKMNLKLYTAQFRYGGKDRIDITSRTSDKLGRLFAPPWSLVSDYKEGKLDENKYTDIYTNILIQSIASNSTVWIEFIALRRVTFVCYCRAGDFCHRIIAAHFCITMASIVEYIGERMSPKWIVDCPGFSPNEIDLNKKI